MSDNQINGSSFEDEVRTQFTTVPIPLNLDPAAILATAHTAKRRNHLWTGIGIALLAIVLALVIALAIHLLTTPPTPDTTPAPNPLATPSATTSTPVTPTPSSPSVTPTPTPTTPSATPTIPATDPPVDATMPNRTPPATIDSTPTATITVRPFADPSDPNSSIPEMGATVAVAQHFADVLASGNLDTLTGLCWMIPPNDLRAAFGTLQLRQQALSVLAGEARVGQADLMWDNGVHLIGFPWTAGPATNPCPDFMSDSEQTDYSDYRLTWWTPDSAQLMLSRLVARHDGTAHAGDVEQDYPLLCSTSQCPDDPTASLSETSITPAQYAAMTQLADAQVVFERLSNGIFRLRATDGSTTAIAYFASSMDDAHMLLARIVP